MIAATILSLSIVLSTDGTLEFSSSPQSVFENAAAILAGVEGVRLEEQEDSKIILKGVVHRASDACKIERFLNQYAQVENQTSLHSEAQKNILAHFQERLRSEAPDLRIRQRGRTFILSGDVSDDFLKRLQSYYPHIRREKAEISKNGIEPSIFLEVVLVEVKKSALEKLGMRMDSPIALAIDSQIQFFQKTKPMLSLGTDPIRLFLDLALQAGEARVHAKQSVVTQNGRMGKFEVGGEFPIRVVSGWVAKVEFKTYGLVLKFTPKLQSSTMIHLDIDSEMSEIDTGSLVDGIPVILRKHLTTQIYAKLDEMMAIGGIVRSSQSQFTDRIPGLSAIPGIGRLFQSEDFKRNKSEAYLFVTPRKMTQPWLPSPEL